MKRIVRALLSIAFALLGVVGVPMHALALSATSSQHSMGGMSHGSSAISCANVCATATFKLEKRQDNPTQEDNNDIKPSLPYYVRYQQTINALAILHTERTQTLVRIEPPPGNTSPYILYSVLRF